MPKPAKKLERINKTAKEIFVYVSILFLLTLASFNLDLYFNPRIKTRVLGAETEDKEITFWKEFLAKNPNYLPGWEEIGRQDKIQEIDPNYITP